MSDAAVAILRRLQAAIDAGDAEQLVGLFDDSAVLVGTDGDARDAEALHAYLAAVAEGEPFRWHWQQVVPFHERASELGFAAFGEAEQDGRRAPFRLTVFAVETHEGWRLRQFHGSIPSGF